LDTEEHRVLHRVGTIKTPKQITLGGFPIRSGCWAKLTGSAYTVNAVKKRLQSSNGNPAQKPTRGGAPSWMGREYHLRGPKTNHDEDERAGHNDPRCCLGLGQARLMCSTSGSQRLRSYRRCRGFNVKNSLCSMTSVSLNSGPPAVVFVVKGEHT